MIGWLKRLLYTQVYINIIPGTKNTTIYVEEVYKKGSFKSYKEVFDSAKKNDIEQCIKRYSKRSPLYYISIIDDSNVQGAMPTCSSKNMAQYCNLGEAAHVCYNKQWGYYSSKLEILSLQNRYKNVGLDFIFSPFIVLVDFFKDKISEDRALYVLVENDAISLSVFDNSKLLYAEHIDMDNDTDINYDLTMNDDIDDEHLELNDDSIDLEDVDVVDEIGSLDEFGDFDDFEELESFDDVDEFVDDDKHVIVDNKMPSLSLDNDSDFGEDYHRFSLIQSSINKFYKDDKYESDFILKVYIADGVGVSQELKKFLQDEMYLDVFVRHIDLGERLCDLAKADAV